MELVSRVLTLNRKSFHEQCCFASYQMEALVQVKIRKACSFSLDPIQS